MPERTFEWNRYLYLIVHGREIGGMGTHNYPNILNDAYLDEIARLESDIPENVYVPMQKKWKFGFDARNKTALNAINKNFQFEV